MGQLKKIIIGATGDYRADNVGPIYGIWIKNKYTNLNGMVLTDAQIKQISSQIGTGASISYQYDVEVNNVFNSIESIKTNVGKSFQQIGASEEDLVSDLTNVKEEITSIGMANFFKRPVERLYYRNIGENPLEENIFMDSFDSDFRELKGTYFKNLSWEPDFDYAELKNELFTDEESMLYSPFSLYVLKDDILSIKGEDKHMAGHLNWDSIPTDDDRPHATGHLFERYYIDRYINAYFPQEELEAYSNAWKKYVLLDHEDEDKELILEWLEEHPMFVLDAWTGDIYQVSENWLYEPSFIYNNEEIDLREIERYNLDGLNPAETNIKIGNGVWADIYYQNVEKTYSFEKKADHYDAWIEAKEYAKNNKNSMSALKRERNIFKLFIAELKELVNTYTNKEN